MLKVRCTNRKKGCRWVGELGALKDHVDAMNGCGYVMVACPNACKKSQKKLIIQKDLQHHLKMQYDERPYKCEHCGKKVRLTKSPVNTISIICPNFPLDCPNRCGVAQMKRSTVDKLSIVKSAH